MVALTASPRLMRGIHARGHDFTPADMISLNYAGRSYHGRAATANMQRHVSFTIWDSEAGPEMREDPNAWKHFFF